MSTFTFQCKSCKRPITLASSFLGRKISCPHCQSHIMALPGDSPPSSLVKEESSTSPEIIWGGVAIALALVIFIYYMFFSGPSLDSGEQNLPNRYSSSHSSSGDSPDSSPPGDRGSEREGEEKEKSEKKEEEISPVILARHLKSLAEKKISLSYLVRILKKKNKIENSLLKAAEKEDLARPALALLFEINPRRAQELLDNLSRSPRVKLRLLAARTIAQKPHPESNPTFYRLFRDSHTEVVEEVIRLAGKSGQKEFIPPLHRLLETSPSLRIDAAQSLLKLGDPSGLRYCLNAADLTTDRSFQKVVIETLQSLEAPFEELEEKGLPPLDEVLDWYKSEWLSRPAALEALGDFLEGPKDSKWRLRARLSSFGRQLTPLALDLLGHYPFESEKQKRTLRHLVLKVGDHRSEDQIFQWALALPPSAPRESLYRLALLRTATEKSASRLRKKLPTDRPDKTLLLLEVFGSLSNQKEGQKLYQKVGPQLGIYIIPYSQVFYEIDIPEKESYSFQCLERKQWEVVDLWWKYGLSTKGKEKLAPFLKTKKVHNYFFRGALEYFLGQGDARALKTLQLYWKRGFTLRLAPFQRAFKKNWAPLFKILKSTGGNPQFDLEVRLQALKILSQAPFAEGAKILIDLYELEKDPEVKKAIWQALETRRDPELASFLARKIRSQTGPHLKEMIQLAPKISYSQPVQKRRLARYIRRLYFKDKTLGPHCLQALGKFGFSNHLSIYLKAIQRSQTAPPIQIAALKALARQGQKGYAYQAWRLYKNSQNRQVKMAAFRAAFALEHPQSRSRALTSLKEHLSRSSFSTEGVELLKLFGRYGGLEAKKAFREALLTSHLRAHHLALRGWWKQEMKVSEKVDSRLAYLALSAPLKTARLAALILFRGGREEGRILLKSLVLKEEEKEFLKKYSLEGRSLDTPLEEKIYPKDEFEATQLEWKKTEKATPGSFPLSLRSLTPRLPGRFYQPYSGEKGLGYLRQERGKIHVYARLWSDPENPRKVLKIPDRVEHISLAPSSEGLMVFLKDQKRGVIYLYPWKRGRKKVLLSSPDLKNMTADGGYLYYRQGSSLYRRHLDRKKTTWLAPAPRPIYFFQVKKGRLAWQTYHFDTPKIWLYLPKKGYCGLGSGKNPQIDENRILWQREEFFFIGHFQKKLRSKYPSPSRPFLPVLLPSGVAVISRDLDFFSPSHTSPPTRIFPSLITNRALRKKGVIFDQKEGIYLLEKKIQ